MKTILFAFLVLASAGAMAASHSGSGMGWFGTQIVSSLIHGVIYGLIFKVFHSLGLVPSLLIGGAVLAGAFVWYRSKRTVS